MSARSNNSRPINRPKQSLQESFLGRLLDPIDRLSETIFAVLTLLSFTLAFVFFEFTVHPGEPITPQELNDLVIAALGATLAWGLISGVIYALTSVFERGEKHRLLSAIQQAETQEDAIQVIADELDHILEPITRLEKRQLLYEEMYDHLKDSQPQPVGLTGDDFAGAVGCMLVAILAVLPSLLPLVLLQNNVQLAIRISNLISFGVLFFAGYQWGKYSGTNPFKIGLLLILIGTILVAIAIPLGG